jgi:hypothetical protein
MSCVRLTELRVKNIDLNLGGVIGALACGGIAAALVLPNIDPRNTGRGPYQLVVLALVGGAFAGNLLWNWLSARPAQRPSTAILETPETGLSFVGARSNAMSEAEWTELLDALHDWTDSERAVAASAKLRRSATKDDVPRLFTLLKDESFFVREAAAWPLSDLGVTSALPDLLEALHRGFQEGHDNDGLCAVLADMVGANSRNAEIRLKQILASGEPHLREHARWLLEFCKERNAQDSAG